MKFIDTIIDEVREDTENEEFNASVGLSEETFIRYINEAINRLHGKIVSQHARVFSTETEIDIVNGQQAYSIPRNAFNNNMIEHVEYSETGLSDDYRVLKQTQLRSRKPGYDGNPCEYIRRAGEILLVPTPTSGGKIRVTYTRKPKRMDKRRGVIKAVTTSGSNITNLEIDYINGSEVDSAEIAKRTRFCVVDKYGTLKMDNILLSSISTSSTYDATLVVDATFAFESGETIAVDDYILSGDFATTHLNNSDFDNNLEDYIRQYCVVRILQRDSSIDQQDAFSVISAMEDQIVENFKDLSSDVIDIPIAEGNDWGL